MGDVGGEVAHYHLVLFDALLVRDDFHFADWTAETLEIRVCRPPGLSHRRSRK